MNKNVSVITISTFATMTLNVQHRPVADEWNAPIEKWLRHR